MAPRPLHGGFHPPRSPFPITKKSITSISIPEILVIPLKFPSKTKWKLLVKKGQKIHAGEKIATWGKEAFPCYAPVSGEIQEISFLSKKIEAPTLYIESNSKEENVIPFSDAISSKNLPEQYLECVFRAGLIDPIPPHVPFYQMLHTAKQHGVEMVILSCLEREPWLSGYTRILIEHSTEIWEGFLALLTLMEVSRAEIWLSESQKKMALRFRKKEKKRKIQIRIVKEWYPLPERFFPKNRLRIRLSASKIFFVDPITTWHVAQAIFSHFPDVERIFTVTGNGIREPQNVRVRIGTPISHVIATCGGYTENRVRLIKGGPLQGKTLSSDTFPVDWATTGLVVVKETHPEKEMPCIACGRCVLSCPVGLVPYELDSHVLSHKTSVIRNHLQTCILCRACDYICPSYRRLSQRFKKAMKTHSHRIEE